MRRRCRLKPASEDALYLWRVAMIMNRRCSGSATVFLTWLSTCLAKLSPFPRSFVKSTAAPPCLLLCPESFSVILCHAHLSVMLLSKSCLARSLLAYIGIGPIGNKNWLRFQNPEISLVLDTKRFNLLFDSGQPSLFAFRSVYDSEVQSELGLCESRSFNNNC